MVPELQARRAMHSNLEPRQRSHPLTWLGRAPLLLLFLAAVPAVAQPTRGPSLAPVGPPTVTVGEAITFDGEPHATTPPRRSTGARVAAEAGGSLVGAVGLGVAGAFGGGLLSLALCDNTDVLFLNFPESCLMSGALVGGLAGVGAGVPLGVWWGGGKAGGNGSLAAALGGAGVSFASAGAAYLLGANDVGAVLLATAPVLSIVGYELADSTPRAPSSAGMTPTVSVSTGGASFGLQGRF